MSSLKNNNNAHHPPSHHSSKSAKPKKNTEKWKRTITNTESKQQTFEFASEQGHSRSQYDQYPSTSKVGQSNKPPTKVKSASWKRSEKQISNASKKSLRKRSPAWLKLPSSSVKITEKVNSAVPNETTSVCRPGTLYSDVLFGAGSPCLVKVKSLTPRRNANTAQKKLTKALLKCTGNEVIEGNCSEAETDKEVFPSLKVGFGKKLTSDNDIKADDNEGKLTECFPTINPSELSDNGPMHMTCFNIPLETSGLGFARSFFCGAQQQFSEEDNNDGLQLRCDLPEKSRSKISLAAEIPQWNFSEIDASSNDAFPKFLGQFDDEYYLRFEQMALAGLKLAMGNNSCPENKFKL